MRPAQEHMAVSGKPELSLSDAGYRVPSKPPGYRRR